MNNQKTYRCIKCNSSFDYYQLKDDLLSCPSCGGHVEDSASGESVRAESAGVKIVNTSYEVLSDPDRRREYDLWIEKCGRPDDALVRPVRQPRPGFQRVTPTSDVRPRSNSKRNALWVLLGLLLIFGGMYDLWDTYRFLKNGTRTYVINADGKNDEGQDSVRDQPSARNTVVLYSRENTSENKGYRHNSTVGWVLLVLGAVFVAVFFGIL